MSDQSGGNTFLQINTSSLRAAVSGWLTWECWKLNAAGDLLFGFFAIVFAAVCIKWSFIALSGYVRVILSLRKEARLRAKGAAGRSDGLAASTKLRGGGMLK